MDNPNSSYIPTQYQSPSDIRTTANSSLSNRVIHAFEVESAPTQPHLLPGGPTPRKTGTTLSKRSCITIIFILILCLGSMFIGIQMMGFKMFYSESDSESSNDRQHIKSESIDSKSLSSSDHNTVKKGAGKGHEGTQNTATDSIPSTQSQTVTQNQEQAQGQSQTQTQSQSQSPTDSDDPPLSQTEFRKKMHSTVKVTLRPERSSATMVLPTRNLNIKGYRGISIGKYKKQSSTPISGSSVPQNLLVCDISLKNEGTSTWYKKENIALRIMNHDVFLHDILHDELDPLETHDTNGLIELYDDSRGMTNTVAKAAFLKRKIELYEEQVGKPLTNGHTVQDVSETISSDPDAGYNEQTHTDGDTGEKRKAHHGVYGKDLSYLDHDEFDDGSGKESGNHGHINSKKNNHHDDPYNFLDLEPVKANNINGFIYATHGERSDVGDVILRPEDISSPTTTIVQATKSTAKDVHHNLNLPIDLRPGESFTWRMKFDFSKYNNNIDAKDINHVDPLRFAFSAVEEIEHFEDIRESRHVYKYFGPVVVLEVDEG